LRDGEGEASKNGKRRRKELNRPSRLEQHCPLGPLLLLLLLAVAVVAVAAASAFSSQRWSIVVLCRTKNYGQCSTGRTTRKRWRGGGEDETDPSTRCGGGGGGGDRPPLVQMMETVECTVGCIDWSRKGNGVQADEGKGRAANEKRAMSTMRTRCAHSRASSSDFPCLLTYSRWVALSCVVALTASTPLPNDRGTGARTGRKGERKDEQSQRTEERNTTRKR
jgi:hypothetical protein